MNRKAARPRQQGKKIEDRIGFAVRHRVRVQVLTILNEGVYTADDIAALIGESRQNVSYHLRELLGAGSIELAKTEKRRNADLFYYRAVEMPSYDREELAALSPAQRQEIAGLIVQCSTVEVIAALAAGKLSNDPRVCLMWRWFNLDVEGRNDLFEEQERFWERVQEIEIESINRCAKSDGKTTAYIVGEWGYERARTAAVRPADADKSANSF